MPDVGHVLAKYSCVEVSSQIGRLLGVHDAYIYRNLTEVTEYIGGSTPFLTTFILWISIHSETHKRVQKKIKYNKNKTDY